LQKNGWNVVLHKAMYLPASPGTAVAKSSAMACGGAARHRRPHAALVCCAVHGCRT
jgi:hypothetical protein